MSFLDVSAEQLAELFHHYHQALGPDFGCAGKPIADSWKEVPQQEKGRMVAATRLTLLELDSAYSKSESPIEYFAGRAKPNGDADCGGEVSSRNVRLQY